MAEIALKPSEAVVYRALSKSALCPLLRSSDYYAGLMDGEGCIGAYRRKKRRKRGGYCYGVQVQIQMYCRPILVSFQARFGGGLYLTSKVRESPVWHWSLTAKPDILSFLKTVAPYLIEKKQQALTMIEYIERIEEFGIKAVDSDAYYLALRQQKRAA